MQPHSFQTGCLTASHLSPWSQQVPGESCCRCLLECQPDPDVNSRVAAAPQGEGTVEGACHFAQSRGVAQVWVGFLLARQDKVGGCSVLRAWDEADRHTAQRQHDDWLSQCVGERELGLKAHPRSFVGCCYSLQALQCSSTSALAVVYIK